MTPAGRAQAAIDLLDEIIAAARAGGAAADTLIARYFKARRYAGSKDRRAVRDLVYRAIRRAGEPPVTGRAALLGLAREDAELAAAFDGSPRGPARIEPDEAVAPAGVVPDWLATRLAGTLDPAEQATLLDRAPLDIRVNGLKATRDQVLPMIADAVPTPHAPMGLRLPEGTNVEALPLFADGLIEIQDEGSQIVTEVAGARPGMTVVDLCAGAGGKTLALAAAMRGEGRLIACDADRARLSRLGPRAERAGIGAVETRLLDGGREGEALVDINGMADVVLVDAPCSGTGTWRRNPEARWRLTPARLDRLVALQARLIRVAAALVRPGGSLTYIVCSLLNDEGADQVAAFLKDYPEWVAATEAPMAGRQHGAGFRLTPAADGTDGFFVARLQRPC
ncbi:16S rRNA (cytosine967-C5)-methyltransferase [Sphingomonas laterariae]|uniref:16S rRNA (Cytosine967-C5)-methyltransferase n=1 Tax=Edaphosphingomonas laterariae TaxID=861865 RepID=A0A239DBU9_9SPHN|nr:RsmB/NOP family class I SAM-dependent RNA methyltransferase [Sphingomonas laterariae]SNS29777.1 16S rRNA (cytosine967-C5)-methyltransferase [Sphingomonas laterariae]